MKIAFQLIKGKILRKDYDIDKLVVLIDSSMLTRFIKEKISHIIKNTKQIDLLFDNRQ